MLATTLALIADARRARAPVLARVAEVRDRGRDAGGRGALQRVHHHHQLHQVVVGRLAGRLQHEHVLAAHVLHHLDHDLAVGELADHGAPERHVEVLGHLLRQARVRVSGEHHQAVHRDVGRERVHGWTEMAGALGFEPRNAGIKIRCLRPAWRRPIEHR